MHLKSRMDRKWSRKLERSNASFNLAPEPSGSKITDPAGMVLPSRVRNSIRTYHVPGLGTERRQDEAAGETGLDETHR